MAFNGVMDGIGDQSGTRMMLNSLAKMVAVAGGWQLE
jgi:hypothetical protein